MERPIHAIEITPGLGNLNAKAYAAAVVGPYRLAHGRKVTKRLLSSDPIELTRNAASSGQALFFAMSLPSNNAGPVDVWVSSDPSLGSNSVPVSLQNQPGFLAGLSYSAVLLPGEQLYAQAVTADVTVVVTEVAF